VLGHQFIEQPRHVVSRDGAFGLHGQALPGEDVLDVEQLQLLAVPRFIELKSMPDRVGQMGDMAPRARPVRRGFLRLR